MQTVFRAETNVLEGECRIFPEEVNPTRRAENLIFQKRLSHV